VLEGSDAHTVRPRELVVTRNITRERAGAQALQNSTGLQCGWWWWVFSTSRALPLTAWRPPPSSLSARHGRRRLVWSRRACNGVRCFCQIRSASIDAVCGSGGGLESWGVWWCWWHVGPATLVLPSSRRKAGPAFVERPIIPVRQAATHAVFLCCFVLEKGRPLGTRTQPLPQYRTHNRTSTQYTPGISAPGGKPERILAGSDG